MMPSARISQFESLGFSCRGVNPVHEWLLYLLLVLGGRLQVRIKIMAVGRANQNTSQGIAGSAPVSGRRHVTAGVCSASRGRRRSARIERRQFRHAEIVLAEQPVNGSGGNPRPETRRRDRTTDPSCRR